MLRQRGVGDADREVLEANEANKEVFKEIS